ncbi:MAG: hypothetical protein RL701_5281 [Pseudomonadota bacterium]
MQTPKLPAQAMAERAPRPPEELVGALQDRIHTSWWSAWSTPRGSCERSLVSAARSRAGLTVRGPEDEHGNVVSIVLAAAADLGEHHRPKLAAADGDLDRIATDAR